MYRQEKDPRKQLIGARSRAAGNIFEDIINAACEYYDEKGVAYIEKTPEPMQPTRDVGNGRFIAYFKKRAQADYKGTLAGGRSIQFEAKHTDHDRILQSVVTEDQAACLDKTEAMGGVCGVIVSFLHQEFFFVPWDVWKNMKQHFGRKYATPKDLMKWKVSRNGQWVLDFLRKDG